MFRQPISLALLVLAVAALIGASTVHAFAPQSVVGKHVQPSVVLNNPFNDANAQEITSSTAIFAAKKPNKSGGGINAEEEKKKQVVDPLELFILFMTPWRNPNSIFLYMLIILNILGRMQESQ